MKIITKPISYQFGDYIRKEDFSDQKIVHPIEEWNSNYREKGGLAFGYFSLISKLDI